MDEIEVAPYIFFQGDCAEAMAFYKNIFGGELDVTAYDDLPPDVLKNIPNVEAMKGKLMNAALSGGLMVIRGADTEEASAEAKKVMLCLTNSDEAKMRKIYEGLSEGAKESSGLEKQFWGDLFGTVQDKFGVEWMVDVTQKA
jgi:PhnB protein